MRERNFAVIAVTTTIIPSPDLQEEPQIGGTDNVEIIINLLKKVFEKQELMKRIYVKCLQRIMFNILMEKN